MLEHSLKQCQMEVKNSSGNLAGDFCGLAALSFSNAVDWAQHEVREARYMQIVKTIRLMKLRGFPECYAPMLARRARKRGFVRVMEPAVGAGVNVNRYCGGLRERGGSIISRQYTQSA